MKYLQHSHKSWKDIYTCNILPKSIVSNGLVIVKQERGLKYRGNVYFEPVTYSLKCCTYVTICLEFDLNSELSDKKVIAFLWLGKIY